MGDYVGDRDIYQIPAELLENPYFLTNLQCQLTTEKRWQMPKYIYIVGRTLNKFLKIMGEQANAGELVDKIIEAAEKLEKTRENALKVKENTVDTISLFETKISYLTDTINA